MSFMRCAVFDYAARWREQPQNERILFTFWYLLKDWLDFYVELTDIVDV